MIRKMLWVVDGELEELLFYADADELALAYMNGEINDGGRVFCDGRPCEVLCTHRGRLYLVSLE